MRDHLRKRRYSCDECGMSFISQENRKRHMITHVEDEREDTDGLESENEVHLTSDSESENEEYLTSDSEYEETPEVAKKSFCQESNLRGSLLNRNVKIHTIPENGTDQNESHTGSAKEYSTQNYDASAHSL